MVKELLLSVKRLYNVVQVHWTELTFVVCLSILRNSLQVLQDSYFFEQNVASTHWRFLNIVNPFLENVQQRHGLYAFRVIMDESNNTLTLMTEISFTDKYSCNSCVQLSLLSLTSILHQLVQVLRHKNNKILKFKNPSVRRGFFM